MANPLLAIMVVLALGARAEVRSQPEHPLMAQLRAQLADAFLTRPDDELFDIASRRGRLLEGGVAAADFDRLEQTVRKALIVQMGRRVPEETPFVFERAIELVAAELRADVSRAVAVYRDRVRPADLPVTSGEMQSRLALLRQVSPTLGPQRRAALATRMQRDQAALTALTRSSAGDAPFAPTAVSADYAPAPAAPIMASVVSFVPERALTPDRIAGLNAIPAAQRYAPANPALDVPAATGERPEGFTTQPIPYGVAVGSLDGVRVRDLMEAARRLPVRTFGGLCLRWVKRAAVRAGLMSPPPRDPRREQARMRAREAFLGMSRAFLMGRLNQMQLEELGLQPIIPSSIPWAPNRPELNGFFLVWAPSCNGEEIGRSRAVPGTHPQAGHVEYVIPQDHPLARGVDRSLIPVKSDGTRGTSPRVLTTYSQDPQISRSWNDQSTRNRAGQVTYRGLGPISQACLTVLAPLDLD